LLLEKAGTTASQGLVCVVVQSMSSATAEQRQGRVWQKPKVMMMHDEIVTTSFSIFDER
jgi:hypothetical protein